MSHPISCLKSKRLHVRLRPTAETLVRGGHPWVYSDSVRDQNREGSTGEMAIVFDRNDNFLAIGLYDSDSPIRIRIIHRGKPANIDATWWRLRLREAMQRRAGILDSETNGLRWINGESDAFPGLVLDQYADTFVLKLYSGVWFQRLDEILQIIREEIRPGRLVLRLSRNIQIPAKTHSLEDASTLVGDPPDGPVIFLESGLKFEADVLKGQKTGFFLDQRENRRTVGELANSKDVLNAFSFSGGFSVHAARGGARSVTDIDISAHALESSRRNFALNADVVSHAKHNLIQADVFEWLRTNDAKRLESYGLIILDPPSLAKRESERAGAISAYANLATAGLRLARQGGVVLCCSCSAHVTAEEFFTAVQKSAARSGRAFQVLQTRREPPDHHATFPEAEYLKAIYLKIG
ncbi:MAG: class I SAM-dependent methyltransferase [Limisphaerales bacterium]